MILHNEKPLTTDHTEYTETITLCLCFLFILWLEMSPYLPV